MKDKGGGNEAVENPFSKEVLKYGTPEIEEQAEMPDLADKLVVQGTLERAGTDRAPKDLSGIHLVLWHLASHIQSKTDGFTSGMTFHASNVSYFRMFKTLGELRATFHRRTLNPS